MRDEIQAPPPILTELNMATTSPSSAFPVILWGKKNKIQQSCTVFVDEAVHNLLDNRCSLRVDDKPLNFSLLSVVSNSTWELRLVLNLNSSYM